MVVFAGKVGAPSLHIRCGIDELAASFVESGAVGYGGLEVDDLGGKLDAAALRREPVALARRCEDLLAEHEEHVAVLYSYRSVSKAIPYYAGEEEARVRGLIVATLGDALAPVLDAMRFADRAVEFCVEAADRALDGGCGALDVETFAAAADAVFTLDLLKDMKAFFPATLTQDIKRLQQAMPDGWPATGEANAGPLSASDFEELTEALVVHHGEDSTIRSYQGRRARGLREDLAFAAPRADALVAAAIDATLATLRRGGGAPRAPAARARGGCRSSSSSSTGPGTAATSTPTPTPAWTRRRSSPRSGGGPSALWRATCPSPRDTALGLTPNYGKHKQRLDLRDEGVCRNAALEPTWRAARDVVGLAVANLQSAGADDDDGPQRPAPAFAAARACLELLRDLRRAAADEYYWKLTHPSISGLEDGSAHDKRTVPFAAALLLAQQRREIQFPIERSLPWILAEHAARGGPGSDAVPADRLLAALPYALDVLRRRGGDRARDLRKRHLYGEIEAEMNLAFDQLVFLVGDACYARVKDRAARAAGFNRARAAPSKTSRGARGGGEALPALDARRQLRCLGRCVDVARLVAVASTTKSWPTTPKFVIKALEQLGCCAAPEALRATTVLHAARRAWGAPLDAFDEVLKAAAGRAPRAAGGRARAGRPSWRPWPGRSPKTCDARHGAAALLAPAVRDAVNDAWKLERAFLGRGHWAAARS
ncbi:cytoplasmic FMR1 interacting protein [Aureococcus anophagefferens]|uniref:Cytoplasmic FMR1 interacting protein n=1 Tax=Aureococcus anophagefferens TaxID=44056 RepID=A0ABR1FXS4_AURAN